MAKSFKKQKTKERYSRDVVEKQRRKERQQLKHTANNYFDDLIDDEYEPLNFLEEESNEH